jgi:hypothetical protein
MRWFLFYNNIKHPKQFLDAFLCEWFSFTNKKQYNCDLNASYNIGALYFIREITKTLPAKERSRVSAKVPDIERRTSNTLNTLKQLNAVLS